MENTPLGCLKRIKKCYTDPGDNKDWTLKEYFEKTKIKAIVDDNNCKIDQEERQTITKFIDKFKTKHRGQKGFIKLIPSLDTHRNGIVSLLNDRTQKKTDRSPTSNKKAPAIHQPQRSHLQEQHHPDAQRYPQDRGSSSRQYSQGQQSQGRNIPEQYPNDVRSYPPVEDGRSRQLSQGDRENSRVHQLLIQQQQEIKALQKQIKEKDLEIESATNRLSAEMNSKVSANETSLENISVKKRPMAVSEAYQNFFSTTWTDAKSRLDELWPNESETRRLSCLCKIFLDSYQFCEELKRRCRVQAYIVDDETEWKEKITSDERSQAFKQSVFDQWKSTGEGIQIPEKSLQQILSKYRLVDGRGRMPDSVRNFAEAAVNLTWEMVIQKPPMTLDTNGIGERWTAESHLELAWGSQQPNKGTIQCYVFPTVKHGGKVMVRGKVLVL